MKDFLQRYLTSISGALSSLSFKGITEITQTPTDEVIQQLTAQHHPEMLTYLWIGFLGGLGGLLVKISWGLFKKMFPKLNNIDK